MVAIEPDTTAAVPDWVFLAFNLPVPVQAGQRWALLTSDPTPSESSLLASAPDDVPIGGGGWVSPATSRSPPSSRRSRYPNRPPPPCRYPSWLRLTPPCGVELE
ncbi:MAG: hypothetical protein R3F11_23325 [Verrucomicrobiales bacterium]